MKKSNEGQDPSPEFFSEQSSFMSGPPHELNKNEGSVMDDVHISEENQASASVSLDDLSSRLHELKLQCYTDELEYTPDLSFEEFLTKMNLDPGPPDEDYSDLDSRLLDLRKSCADDPMMFTTGETPDTSKPLENMESYLQDFSKSYAHMDAPDPMLIPGEKSFYSQLEPDKKMEDHLLNLSKSYAHTDAPMLMAGESQLSAYSLYPQREFDENAMLAYKSHQKKKTKIWKPVS